MLWFVATFSKALGCVRSFFMSVFGCVRLYWVVSRSLCYFKLFWVVQVVLRRVRASKYIGLFEACNVVSGCLMFFGIVLGC